MEWCVPRMWEGGDVWILGGGPSLTKQFNIPDKIVEDVRNNISPPSIYSPYMEAIHNKHVIAINVAYLIGTWIDMCFFGDNKFFLPNMSKLALWPGLKVTCFSGIKQIPWIKYLAQDVSRPHGISPNPRMVAWNVNSGSAAISVAANAGAKRIILVGFDMNLSVDGRQHWHTLYKGVDPTVTLFEERNKGIPMRATKSSFLRHLNGFPAIAKDARERGIEIINASPTSAIKEFPKMTIKELLFDNT